MKRQAAEQRGRRAETLAAWYLRLKGWRILARRVRTPAGEVDLIARRGKMTVFVEVKARGNLEDLGLAIDNYRLRRVAAAAQALSAYYVPEGGDVRIDVILIAPGVWPKHLVNAWEG